MTTGLSVQLRHRVVGSFLSADGRFTGTAGRTKVVDSLFRLPSNTRRWPSEIAKRSPGDSCGEDTSGRESVFCQLSTLCGRESECSIATIVWAL